MSSASDGGEQPAPPAHNTNSNSLHTSNSTSGFFLGRQPRGWESRGLSIDHRTVGAQQPLSSATRPRVRQICATTNSDASSLNTAGDPPHPSVLANVSCPVTASPQNAPSAARPTFARPHSINAATSSNVHDIRPQASRDMIVGQYSVPPDHRHSQISPVNDIRSDLEGLASSNRFAHPPSQSPSTAVNVIPNSSHSPPGHSLPVTTGSTACSPHARHLYANQARGPASSAVRPATMIPAPPQQHVQSPSGSLATAQAPLIETATPRKLQNFLTPEHIGVFEAKVRTVNAAKALTIPEQRRINSIREAMASSDMFFLLLHQILCAYTVHPQILMPNISLSPQHMECLRTLNLVWGNHQLMGTLLMSILCLFPIPLQEFHSNRALHDWVVELRDFLPVLVHRWTLMRCTVFARGFLPFAIEMDQVWDISYLTARAFFIHMFHQLYPKSTRDFSEQTLALFLESQKSSIQYARNPGTRPSLQSVIGSYNRKFFLLLDKHKLHQAPAPTNTDQVSGNRVSDIGLTVVQQTPNTNEFVTQGRLHHEISRPQNRLLTATTVSPSLSSPGASRSVNMQLNSRSSLFPAQGQNAPIFAHPDPTRSALHQTTLAEPQIRHGDGSALVEECKMYAFMESFLDEPKLIDNHTLYESWSVLLPTKLAKDRVKVTPAVRDNGFDTKSYIVFNGSALIYLRCVELLTGAVIPAEAHFSAAVTSWPQHIFVSINGIHLDFRRKGQYGRDLPCDVTHLLHEGSNNIELSYHVATREAGKAYALGLEIIRNYDHSWALKAPSLIDAQLSLDGMIKMLKQHNQHDDIVMSDPYISIDLIDPISACIFDQPVRGKFCFHRECFDLDSYLRSRICRNKNGLVYPDEWRCPICKKDARPISLVIDGFLMQVKEKLIRDGAQDVRAILVLEDGSWQPKTDRIDQSISLHSAPEQTSRSNGTPLSGVGETPRKNEKNAPIILLDDDD